MKANVTKNVNELLDINELKSDNAPLKADVEKNTKELKSDMKPAIKASRDEIMARVGAFESRVEKVEKSKNGSNGC